MENMIANHINGNNKDAKRLAQRHSWRAIFLHLQGIGWSNRAAEKTADFLKGCGTFQEACDAQYADKEAARGAY